MKEKLHIYINENLYNNLFYGDNLLNSKNRKKAYTKESKNIIHELSENVFYDFDVNENINKQSNANINNIDTYIKQNKNKYNDFQSLLFNMIDSRKLNDSEVYNKVHIDRRLFSKIRNDKNYHPSKETVLLLGFALELNEQEIEKLLESASYSLPKNNYYDLIIRFCFINKIYKLVEINSLLDEYNCKLFNY